MNDKVPEKIDYIVFEGEMVRQERYVKRLWIMCIIIFAALILTNAGWLWYESQWEEQVITQDVQQDADFGGMNKFTGNVIGGDYNGETENYNND